MPLMEAANPPHPQHLGRFQNIGGSSKGVPASPGGCAAMGRSGGYGRAQSPPGDVDSRTVSRYDHPAGSETCSASPSAESRKGRSVDNAIGLAQVQDA